MTLTCRLVTAGFVYVNTVSSSGIVQFGDAAGATTSTNRLIAVQRAVPIYDKDETRFSAYPLFYKLKLQPGGEPPARLNSSSAGSPIRVGNVCVLGISTSSVLRFGCSGPIGGESRIVNIRQFNDLQFNNRDAEQQPGY
ncbi:spore germination protein GerPE [Cohnella fermenti]|uniref:Spore germination protein GerPE n=1 Tax=Cohnella fermenti TaxID=2565925 RepID=A0A4S4BEU4_9BACL|nr:spore germination protein GerPE [Cohnella fermenti]THF72594.1 spore germination protein GerPE [Cohnella fermenti]